MGCNKGGGGGGASAARPATYSSGGGGGGSSSSGISRTFNRKAAGAPVVRQGTRHTETYTSPRPTDNPKYPDHKFSSRQAKTNDGSFIGKTSEIRDRSGNLVERKHGKSGKGPVSTGFFSGLFNWLSK